VTSDAELEALVALRDAACQLIAAESDDDAPDNAREAIRREAADLYAAYVERWGPLNRGVLDESRLDPQTGLPAPVWRRPDLGGFRRDPEYLTVLALEVFDQSTGTAAPAPILQRRVHGGGTTVGGVANAVEALAVGAGDVDLDRIAALAGLPDAAAAERELGELIFRDPEQDGRWVTARAYLAGDVRARHAIAVAAARDDEHYRRNVDALAAVVPTDLGPLDIAVALGAPWVPATDVEAFVHEVLGGRVKVWHLPSAASWRIVPLGKVPAQAFGWTTHRVKPYDLLAAGLNGRTPMVFEIVYVAGKRHRVRNQQESLAAQEKLAALQERFRTWIWEDAARTRRLTAEFNRRFNTHLVRRHDGSALTFPGLADSVSLWPWQRDIVARIIGSPATLCAHAVGAGKTRSMVAAAVTARRLGLARKPLIAVPTHLVEQTAREARQAFPTGRFLIAGEDVGSTRAELAARCTTGEWDAVIMSHGTFSALPVAPATEAAWLAERRDEVDAQVAAGRGGRFGRAGLHRRRAALEARIEALGRADTPAITFDTLGVDLLLVDEAHYFKRLPVVSRLEGVSLGASKRAADLLLKAQILRARRGSRPSLALFTGTPWSNSIAETFVWQTFVQPDVLADAGIDTFDAWAAVFVDFETVVEVTPDGADIRLKQRPSRIRNVPELQALLARSADVLPASSLGLDRPERDEDTVVCEPGPRQLEYVRSLGARADKIRGESVKSEPGGDNMLALCGDGRRAALDPALVGVAEASPKVAALADEVARIYHENATLRLPGSDAEGVLQLVFCDQGTPGPNGLQTYGRIRIALAERGVPPERVRWVHAARTGPERAALFAACRAGGVSVLIGSTDKVGVGTNVQARLRAIHHADAPWRPSDIEQREGRAFRPGNLNPVVTVLRYVTIGTFDAYMWQTLERKAAFIEQLGRTDRREADDLGDATLTFAEVKALAAGNPLLLDHARAQAEVARLRLLRAIDTQTVTEARRTLAAAERDQVRHHQHSLILGAARDRLAARGPSDAVEAAVATLGARLRDPASSDDPAPVRVPWRGLGVELIPAGGWRASDGRSLSVRITLSHRRVDELVLPLRGGRPPGLRRVLTALADWVKELDHRVDAVAELAAAAYDTAVAARGLIDTHRFPRLDELLAAEARLAEIEVALEAATDGRITGAA
jgi:N12 class adenine-specific DNA methylase